MKSQVILCIVIIFSIDLLHAESNESEESNSCYDQWLGQKRTELACIHAVLNETELLSAVNATILNYAGDDEAVRVQTKKFCPVLSTALECALKNFALDNDCLAPIDHANKRHSYDLVRTTLNYLCANNSEVILQILKNNGVNTIYDNKKTYECLTLINVRKIINEETLLPTTELCDGFNQFYGCYTNYVRDHKNENLVRIASEFKELHRQSLKCPSAHEL